MMQPWTSTNKLEVADLLLTWKDNIIALGTLAKGRHKTINYELALRCNQSITAWEMELE